MAESFTFNIAKGRIVELALRVVNNDPSTSGLILVPLAVGGTAAQGQDFDTLSAVLGNANFDEAGASWGRKTVTDSTLTAPVVDSANDRYPVTMPEITWTVPTLGEDVVALLVCYDSNTGSGTDAAVVPLTQHAWEVVPDSVNDVILNSSDFYRDT